MAVWKNEHFVVTNAGDEMLSKAVAGEGEIKVTRIVTGGSYVTPEKLKEQTEVKKIKQTLDIVGVDTDNEGSMITARLSNKDLTDGYLLYQIGIYATFGEDTTEVLYMLAQCDFINPDIIPAAEDTPHQSVYNLYLKHSGTDKITFNVSDTMGVTFSMFDDLKKSTKNSIETMQTEVLGMSESLTTMDEKLNSHISDKEIHITAEERETWNGKADKEDIPETLPANGGNADAAERTVWENHVKDNTDILELADNAPVLQRSFVRVNSSKNCPTDYGYSETNNDFWYVIDKLDALYATIIAVDVKSSAIFINTKSSGSWMGWKKIITDE